MTNPSRSALRAVAGAIGLAAACGLTGCVDTGPAFSVLDREAQEVDALPTDLPDYADDNLDPASSRFVGEHDGDRLYLAKGEDSSVCLVIFPDDGEWVAGCSGDYAPFTVGSQALGYEVRPDSAPVPTGAERISENVFVLD